MFLIRLFSFLPLGVLYVFSDFLFFLSYYIVRYRRPMVQNNIRNSFPEKSEAQLQKIERDFYKNLCDYAVETLKLITISKKDLSHRMKFSDAHFLKQFADKNQSIVFLASHQFNWEWMMVSASINFPMKIDFVYQPVFTKLFDRVTMLSRTRFGAHPIPRDAVAREIVKRKEIVRGIAIVADQYPGYKSDKKYPAKFLHQDTVFFYGANSIASLTQYPVIYCSIKKIRRGYYEASPQIVALPPYGKNDNTVVDNYITLVEKVIRENPSGWLWSHNRWKTRHLNEVAS
jgi:KDO2-lipid IV(A) lauroyltransferase